MHMFYISVINRLLDVNIIILNEKTMKTEFACISPSFFNVEILFIIGNVYICTVYDVS